MKLVKDKEILVGADFAGFPLKEAVTAHLKVKGWTVTDVGVRSTSDDDTENMFHRVGLRAGAMISEGVFERAL
ncbi:MAG: RpiB/LacA/LacB family sugar-phosphate isomerase, partial [Clostridiales bacterium]|nr:RpiB/LacA/LacB family sugar-phosphate isomerase [Clostridiales bacterium]